MVFIQSYLNLEYYQSDNETFDTMSSHDSLDIDVDDYSESEVGSTEYYADKEYSDESSDDDIRNIFNLSEKSGTDDDYIKTNIKEVNLSDDETVNIEMERHECTSNKKEDDNETIRVKLESYEISVYEKDDATVKVEIDSCRSQIVKIKMKFEDNMESYEPLSCEKENSHEYDQDRVSYEALKTIKVKLESGEYFDSLEEFLRYDEIKVKMESSKNSCNDEAVRTKMESYKPFVRNLNNQQEITGIKIDWKQYNATLPYETFNCEKEDGNVVSMKDFGHSNKENLSDSEDVHPRYSSKREFECKGVECHRKQHKRCRLDNLFAINIV